MTRERGTCGKVLLASKGVVVLQDKWVPLPPWVPLPQVCYGHIYLIQNCNIVINNFKMSSIPVMAKLNFQQ